MPRDVAEEFNFSTIGGLRHTDQILLVRGNS
jgi:hypothetical protein